MIRAETMASVESGVRPSVPDRIYVHQLNLTSADVVRRRLEKEMVEEEAQKAKERRDIQRRKREEEKKRDMEMLLSYNPWGKPGAGAKWQGTEQRRRRPEKDGGGEEEVEEEEEEDFIRRFGRPGHGAPNRTRSGKLRTQLAGDPDIRFQDTQDVRLSIENQLRYKRGGDDPRSYRLLLDPMFMATRPKRIVLKDEDFDPWGQGFGNPDRDKRGNVRRHKFVEQGAPDSPLRGVGGAGAPHLTDSGRRRTRLRNTLRNFKSMGPHIDDSYDPWGRPGGGAAFVRKDGRVFEEKLGWSMTGHPKKRTRDAKNEYKNELRQEIREQDERRQKERLQIQEPSSDVASIIRQGVGGRPRKDPATGELTSNPRRLTDVTRQRLDIRRAKSQESLAYRGALSEQAARAQEERRRQEAADRERSAKHLSTWDSFWGRPGHGAPKDPVNHRKENLDDLLEARPPEYEFRTPFPAAAEV